MKKNQKQSPKKKQAVKEVVKQEEKKESTSEILLKTVTNLKKDNLSGVIVCIAGPDGKIVPYAQASSVGELLTLEYVIKREIKRLVDGLGSKEQPK